MYLRISLIFTCFLFFYGCSDHQTGYREGYENNGKKQWIVFGRSDYLKGYSSGQAEKFQDDWVSEEPIEVGLLNCPSIIIPADPLMFLPTDYKQMSHDIYSNEQL